MSGYVGLPPDGTGKKVDTSELVVSSNTVERQNVCIADGQTAAAIADVTAKGSQAAYGLGVQELKDAGRTPITLYANSVTGVTSEALLTITQVKGGTAQTAATNYTVTSGKTFRITSFTVTGTTSAAAVNNVRGTMRYVTSGTVTASSAPIITAQAAGIVATSGSALIPVSIMIADGFEIPSGANYGISQIANSTSTTISVMVTGFEY